MKRKEFIWYEKITGMMVYYYNVCKRKLWFFSNEINMEDCSEDVKIGALLDQKSYGREDKHINIDNVINIDFSVMKIYLTR